VEQGSSVRLIGETSASNQEDKKSGNQNGPEDDGAAFCVKSMDTCYEDCKHKEAQPEYCNLNCTTDKICGMPMRMSYGQFLDLQVEMLAAKAKSFPKASERPQNANNLPAQPGVSPGPRRRAHDNRHPSGRPRPATGQPAAVSAETQAAGNSGWPHLSLP